MGNYSIGMNSRDYWYERLLDRDAAAKKSEDEVLKMLHKHNKDAFMEIKKELNDFYIKYGLNNRLTLQDAKKKLTPIEFTEYKKKMEQLQQLLKTTKGGLVYKEIEKLNARLSVTRYQALLDSINVELIKYSNNMQISLEDHLTKIYQREYKSALEGLNVSPIPVINTNAIKEIINYPYAGAMFSSRIWKNKNQLLKWIDQDLTKHLIKGSSIQEMSAELMQRRNVLKYQAERLVRTETNYAMTQGHMSGYKAAGLNQYEILAQIDSRTSKICQSMNGTIVDIEDQAVGINCPPFHPNCRTTIMPVVYAPVKVPTKEDQDPEIDDPILRSLSSKNVIDMTQKNAAAAIMQELQLDHIPRRIKSIKENGYCSLDFDLSNDLQYIKEYVLDSKDQREQHYKIKTAFHEAFHAKANGRKTDFHKIRDKWTYIEETFAETAAHYAMKIVGNTKEISPSYAEKLIDSLPRLKQLPEFKDCKTLVDFGEVAWNNRINGSQTAEWLDLYNKTKNIKHHYADYARDNGYIDYMKRNKLDLIDLFLQNSPTLKPYKSQMIDELNSALKYIEDGGSALAGNEKIVFQNALVNAMNRMGVK